MPNLSKETKAGGGIGRMSEAGEAVGRGWEVLEESSFKIYASPLSPQDKGHYFMDDSSRTSPKEGL